MLLRETFGRPASAPAEGRDPRRRPDLQHRRQRAGLEDNRPGQVGPEDGMGQRANARGLDLNRDFIKLEAPETRGLVRFLNEWNPHLFIDTHTTDGSYHRYTITYEGPKNPAGDPKVIAFMRQTFFPEVTHDFEKQTGFEVVLLRKFQPRPHAVDDRIRPRGATARPTSGCGTGCRFSPRRIPTPRTRRACWPRATSCSTVSRPPSSHKAEIMKLLAPAQRRAERRRRRDQPVGADPVASQGGGEAGDRARLCRAATRTAGGQDRDAQGLHGQAHQRVRGDRVGHAPVRLPDPARSSRGRRRPSSGTGSTCRSCARTSSSTSRSTRSTRSRNRRGGSRATMLSSCA